LEDWKSECCLPTTCWESGRQCGEWPNGCGGEIDCGECLPTQRCNAEGTCVGF
jgi:hypothetical protein